MYASICGQAAIPFAVPVSKTTLKNWVSGVSDNRLRAILQDDNRQTLCRLVPKFHPPTGQYQAKPQTFQIGDTVFTAWYNLQPDKYGRAGRYGYTLCVKRLYNRETIREDAPDPLEAEAEMAGV